MEMHLRLSQWKHMNQQEIQEDDHLRQLCQIHRRHWCHELEQQSCSIDSPTSVKQPIKYLLICLHANINSSDIALLIHWG